MADANLWSMFAWIHELNESGCLDPGTELIILNALRGVVDTPEAFNEQLKTGDLSIGEFMEQYGGIRDPYEMSFNIAQWPWLFAACEIAHAFTCCKLGQQMEFVELMDGYVCKNTNDLYDQLQKAAWDNTDLLKRLAAKAPNK